MTCETVAGVAECRFETLLKGSKREGQVALPQLVAIIVMHSIRRVPSSRQLDIGVGIFLGIEQRIESRL